MTPIDSPDKHHRDLRCASKSGLQPMASGKLKSELQDAKQFAIATKSLFYEDFSGPVGGGGVLAVGEFGRL
jgi:hypothetical protein